MLSPGPPHTAAHQAPRPPGPPAPPHTARIDAASSLPRPRRRGVGPPAAEGACERGSRAQPARPAPSNPAVGRRSRTRANARLPPHRTPASVPRVPGGRRIRRPPGPHCPRLLFPAGGSWGCGQSLGFPAAAATATPPEGPARATRLLVSRRPAHPQRSGAGQLEAPELARPAPPPPAARASRSGYPRSLYSAGGESALGTLPQERAKEESLPGGRDLAGRRRASRWLLAGASCLSAGLPAPCPARPPCPAPARPGRRRLSRPNDDAAARLPPLPPRCRPRWPPGAHLPLAGAHSHTRTHAPEGSTAAAAATRARVGGGEGARARQRPPGGAPANNVGGQPPAPGRVPPGRERVKGGSGQGPGERGYERVQNPGAREGGDKGSEGERPGKPGEGAGPGAHPAEGRGGGRPGTVRFARPFAPGAQQVSAGPTPLGSAQERERGRFSPSGPGQTHLCLFSLLSWGRAFLKLSVVALVAPRPGPCPWADSPES